MWGAVRHIRSAPRWESVSGDRPPLGAAPRPRGGSTACRCRWVAGVAPLGPPAGGISRAASVRSSPPSPPSMRAMPRSAPRVGGVRLTTSGLDFLVELGPMEPYERVDAYFGLLDVCCARQGTCRRPAQTRRRSPERAPRRHSGLPVGAHRQRYRLRDGQPTSTAASRCSPSGPVTPMTPAARTACPPGTPASPSRTSARRTCGRAAAARRTGCTPSPSRASGSRTP